MVNGITMPYSYKNSKGDIYFLHLKKTGKSGLGKLYYFAKSLQSNSHECFPEGYTIAENKHTGMPLIKKNI